MSNSAAKMQGRKTVIKFTCNRCGKDIPDVGSEFLDRIKKVGIADRERIRAISGQLREGYPLKGHKPASDEEILVFETIGRELADLLFYKQIFCEQCSRTNLK